MKMESLSIAFFYFSESGLFNGLQPIQARKIPPMHQVVFHLSQTTPILIVGASPLASCHARESGHPKEWL
jgi:hypothetical protein